MVQLVKAIATKTDNNLNLSLGPIYCKKRRANSHKLSFHLHKRARACIHTTCTCVLPISQPREIGAIFTEQSTAWARVC